MEIFVKANLWEIFYYMESSQKTKILCYFSVFKCYFSISTAIDNPLCTWYVLHNWLEGEGFMLILYIKASHKSITLKIIPSSNSYTDFGNTWSLRKQVKQEHEWWSEEEVEQVWKDKKNNLHGTEKKQDLSMHGHNWTQMKKSSLHNLPAYRQPVLLILIGKIPPGLLGSHRQKELSILQFTY